MGQGRLKLCTKRGTIRPRGGVRPADRASLMRKLLPIALVTLALVTISGIIRQGKAQEAEAYSLPTFTDVTAKAGIQFQHQASRTTPKDFIETMGAGVVWLDYDGDGFLDLFFVNGAALEDPQPDGKLPVQQVGIDLIGPADLGRRVALLEPFHRRQLEFLHESPSRQTHHSSSVQWILSLNSLSHFWGQVQMD